MTTADLLPPQRDPIKPTDIDTKVNCEPRIHDLRLAEALGFSTPVNIRKLIESHKAALERLGTLVRYKEKPTHRGGRPSEGWALNKKQALYITTKSDTSFATDITIQIVEVFDTVTSEAKHAGPAIPYQGPAPLALPLRGQTLTTAQIFHPAILAQVEERAKELAEASLPRLQSELVREVMTNLMAGIPVDIKKEHFRVSILRRYEPGSEDEERFMIDRWAWEMVPDVSNVAMRDALKAAITPILRGEKPPVKK